MRHPTFFTVVNCKEFGPEDISCLRVLPRHTLRLSGMFRVNCVSTERRRLKVYQMDRLSECWMRRAHYKKFRKVSR